MDGLVQDLGLGRGLGRREGHGGEAGDEHDAHARLTLGCDAGDLDAVRAGHDDVGQEQVVRTGVQGVDRVVAVLAGDDRMPGLFQRAGQEAAQRAVIFSQKDVRHATLPRKVRREP